VALIKFKKFDGSNLIMEIDETKFGNRKHSRGHKVNWVLAVDAVERISKRIVLKHLEKRDSIALVNFCRSFISNEQSMFSDFWRGYSALHKYFKEHRTVNHSLEFVNRNTYTIEGNCNAVKK
jgi:DNA-binding PucR family transcriptional regulator